MLDAEFEGRVDAVMGPLDASREGFETLREEFGMSDPAAEAIALERAHADPPQCIACADEFVPVEGVTVTATMDDGTEGVLCPSCSSLLIALWSGEIALPTRRG